MQRLTREIVSCSFGGVRERYRKALAEIFSLASSDRSIRRLEITLHGHHAAYRFPIDVWAWTEHWQDPPDTAVVVAFPASLGEVPLLPVEFRSLPIGRDDIAGADFTPELCLVNDVLLEETQAAWGALHALCRPDIAVHVGPSNDPSVEFEEESSRLNLRSGAWETVPPRSEEQP